jgi:hypothetical protein
MMKQDLRAEICVHRCASVAKFDPVHSWPQMNKDSHRCCARSLFSLFPPVQLTACGSIVGSSFEQEVTKETEESAHGLAFIRVH